MTRSKTILLLVLIVAAAGASTWLLRPQLQQATSGHAPDAPAAVDVAADDGPAPSAGGPVTPGRLPVADPAEVALANGRTMAQALADNSEDGRIRSEAQANLLAMASANCAQAPDLNPVATDGYGFDETRAWAIARIIEICADFDPSRFNVDIDRPNLIAAVQQQGWGVAQPIVTETLERSGIMADVFTAGQLMMENNAFPYDEVMPGMERDYGLAEIQVAWAQASTLATCDSVGGCGPGSLQVVQVCANVGCPDGLNLRQVLERRLPPGEYRAAMAMYAWLHRRRNSG